jgi:phenylpropionate dioxygenase-like ring-hydroxylating dioxygenase large terminal subunit
MFVKNAWYVAATSRELLDKPLARVLVGERVVLFRTAEGVAVALEDRCCHRLAPLSLGDVEPGGIRCRYHGMKFNTGGQCVEIPGQDQIPPGMCVRAYPLVERHGFLWIWPGRADLANPDDIFDVHWNGAPGWPTAHGYIHYKANYQLIADNLLDFSHLTFVHRTTLANPALLNSRPEIESFERGIRVNRLIVDCDPSPLHGMAGRFSGRVDFWNRQIWWLPSVFENWAGSVPTGGEGLAHERAGGLHLRHFSLLTPETEQTTHYFWVQPCQFPHDDDAMIEKVGVGIETAFAEDRWMIEAQQQVINASPEIKPKSIRSDAALGRVRFMLDRLLEQERSDAQPGTPRIPIAAN